MNPTFTSAVFIRFVFLLVSTSFAIGIVAANDRTEQAAKVEFFEKKIRPILVEYCYECHAFASEDNGGELRLDGAVGLNKGGTRGPVISKEKPQESLLLQAILYDIPDLQMPPAGKLPPSAIDDIRTWIEQGAVDPRVESTAIAAPMQIREQTARQHWSFQPLPYTREKNSSATDPLPIDLIVKERLAEKGLVPNPSASKRELIRRLYYDLVGLQPTWEQYQVWDNEPLDNYESWVDQLLASPHFGERMARRWMDVSRYADTKGYVFTEDREYANAWRFRDWLIGSFNNDLPFDQFASFQIAADRLDPGPDNKNLDAMGFLTLGRRFLNNENDIADDRIDVISRGFMGLSVACARCHDHKFDAIGMADYYSMHAALVSSKEPKDEPGPLRMVDSEKLRPAVIFKRGQPGQLGDTVPKRFVNFLTSVSRPMETGSGRLDMAQAIVDKNNPLTARVFANRIWGWFLGVPLVDTPSDFGMRCPSPPQRELLDRLAADFVSDNFSTKRLIKRIVMSDTYRRSSANEPVSFAIDPENLAWWRGNRKRLDFESLRDSVLVACQQLERTVGGPSIKLIDPPFSNRRTLYAYIDRQNLPGVFRSFDFASPDSHVANRLSTTVPQQGLFMMNSPMIDHYATEFSKRWVGNGALLEPKFDESKNQKALQIAESIFQSILLRNPSAKESERNLNYLRSNSKDGTDLAKFAWDDFIKAILSTNEFCFID